MILMKDVTHYTVGDQEFKVGTVHLDANGHPHHGAGYRLALKASEETGLSIVAHGPNSVRSKTSGWDYEVAA